MASAWHYRDLDASSPLFCVSAVTLHACAVPSLLSGGVATPSTTLPTSSASELDGSSSSSSAGDEGGSVEGDGGEGSASSMSASLVDLAERLGTGEVSKCVHVYNTI